MNKCVKDIKCMREYYLKLMNEKDWFYKCMEEEWNDTYPNKVFDPEFLSYWTRGRMGERQGAGIMSRGWEFNTRRHFMKVCRGEKEPNKTEEDHETWFRNNYGDWLNNI